MEQPSLLDHIIKQNRTGLSPTDFLKQLTATYPYFTAAQFYLLQQTPATGSNYKKQAAKTAVLFNNPHWLNFQLQQANAAVIIPELVNNDMVLSIENTHHNDDGLVTAANLTARPVAEQSVAFITTPQADEEKLQFAENSDNNDDEVAISPASTDVATVAEGHEEEATAAEAAPALTEEQLMLAENADNDDDSGPMEEEIAPIKITIPGPVEQHFDANAPAFEPMHLVDYFASQGIKLSDEVQPADKLGKQLKSFTEWLKTMKKIHVPATEASSGTADISVQNLAEKSNTEGEVLTEAMAEVLSQQGKVGKAIEVYQKLSLLNPAKSAFFAAKIEQLKG